MKALKVLMIVLIAVFSCTIANAQQHRPIHRKHRVVHHRHRVVKHHRAVHHNNH